MAVFFNIIHQLQCEAQEGTITCYICQSVCLFETGLDFVILLEEDVGVDILSCSAILDVVMHPGDGGDNPLLGVGDVMVPCPIQLVGVC